MPLCDVIIVTVPTPVSLDKHLDQSHVYEAGCSVFQNLSKHCSKILVLESTVYPGFTKKIWLPIASDLGLVVGEDVHLAYCPERYNPGDKKNTISKINRIVGSMRRDVGEFVVALYSSINDAEVSYVGQMEVAESAKLIENVQRDINIALVNELSMILPKLGVDIEEVLNAASTKWNFHRYSPGIGVGGHCIPVDPYFLIDQAVETNSSVELISSAREINTYMPIHVSNIISEILESHDVGIKESRILILGWSYKPNIGDSRGSPSLELAKILNSKGAIISCCDAHVASQFPDFVSRVSIEGQTPEFDIVILATAHDDFVHMDWEEFGSSWNRLDYIRWPKKSGFG